MYYFIWWIDKKETILWNVLYLPFNDLIYVEIYHLIYVRGMDSLYPRVFRKVMREQRSFC